MTISTQQRPALLIIGMQNDFLTPGSGRLYNPSARALISTINQLTAAARSGHVPVIWIVQEHRHQLVDFGREGDISPPHCVEGTRGAEICRDLVRAPEDFIVVKRRFSGFYGTDLDLLLRCLDCNTIVLTGINTDGCVYATAVDAHARDYFLRVIAEGTAGWDVVAYQTALIGLGRLQPEVVISVDQAVDHFLELPVREGQR
jgi:nicotinamidase-related amidase